MDRSLAKSLVGKFPVVAHFIVVAAVLIIIFGIRYYILATTCSDWSEGTGEIIESKVARTFSEKPEHRYISKVKYKYVVNGKSYIGKRITFQREHIYSQHSVDFIIDKYPVGKIVKVYYSPNNPRNVVLERGYSKKVYFAPIFGVVLLLLATVLYLFKKYYYKKCL